jgi:hypothetical protein
MPLGRGFDAWLTTDPRDNQPDILCPGDKGYPQCSDCGGFLRREPDLSSSGEITEQCPGKPEIEGFETGCDNPTTKEHEPHTYVAHAWGENHHRCRKCGKDNVLIDA